MQCRDAVQTYALVGEVGAEMYICYYLIQMVRKLIVSRSTLSRREPIPLLLTNPTLISTRLTVRRRCHATIVVTTSSSLHALHTQDFQQQAPLATNLALVLPSGVDRCSVSSIQLTRLRHWDQIGSDDRTPPSRPFQCRIHCRSLLLSQ